MKDLFLADYQDCVSKILLRNKSILDILSKMNTTQGRIQRDVAKAVTHCGCIEIDAKKQPVHGSLEEFSQNADFHIAGNLCKDCKSILEQEMGNHLFYFTSLCTALDINIYDIILKEKQKLETLGRFSLR